MPDMKKAEFPENRVVATLDANVLEAAVNALASAGYSRDAMFFITPDDIGHVDSPLTESGLTGFVHRLILSFGVDRRVLEQLRGEVVDHGRVIVTVPVDKDEEKAQAVEILKHHDAHSLMYVGRWAMEQL